MDEQKLAEYRDAVTNFKQVVQEFRSGSRDWMADYAKVDEAEQRCETLKRELFGSRPE